MNTEVKVGQRWVGNLSNTSYTIESIDESFINIRDDDGKLLHASHQAFEVGNYTLLSTSPTKPSPKPGQTWRWIYNETPDFVIQRALNNEDFYIRYPHRAYETFYCTRRRVIDDAVLITDVPPNFSHVDDGGKVVLKDEISMHELVKIQGRALKALNDHPALKAPVVLVPSKPLAKPPTVQQLVDAACAKDSGPFAFARKCALMAAAESTKWHPDIATPEDIITALQKYEDARSGWTKPSPKAEKAFLDHFGYASDPASEIIIAAYERARGAK